MEERREVGWRQVWRCAARIEQGLRKQEARRKEGAEEAKRKRRRRRRQWRLAEGIGNGPRRLDR